MIGDEAAAQLRAAELHSILELQHNPEWVKIQAKLDTHLAEHLSGATDRKSTQEQRDTHLEAYHMASELAGYVGARIFALKGELDEFRKISGGKHFGFEHEVEV